MVKPLKVVLLADGREITAVAWYFRWRREQRFARLHPDKAAVMAAERLLQK